MGLIRGVARTAVVAGTATAVSNRVSRRQAGRWAQQEERSQPQATAQQPPAAGGAMSMDDKMDHLKTLADLKAQGVLSEAEFEQQKAAILNS